MRHDSIRQGSLRQRNRNALAVLYLQTYASSAHMPAKEINNEENSIIRFNRHFHLGQCQSHRKARGHEAGHAVLEAKTTNDKHSREVSAQPVENGHAVPQRLLRLQQWQRARLCHHVGRRPDRRGIGICLYGKV